MSTETVKSRNLALVYLLSCRIMHSERACEEKARRCVQRRGREASQTRVNQKRVSVLLMEKWNLLLEVIRITKMRILDQNYIIIIQAESKRAYNPLVHLYLQGRAKSTDSLKVKKSYSYFSF